MENYAEELARSAEEYRARLEQERKIIIDSLKTDIQRRGLEQVLADILIDGTEYYKTKCIGY